MPSSRREAEWLSPSQVMPAQSHSSPPDVSGEASQLPWQCQARELERLASKQSATTRNSLQPQRSTACLKRRHLHSRCEPAVRHRLEAGTATHSHTSIADLLEHKSANIIHELQSLVNKPSLGAHIVARALHRWRIVVRLQRDAGNPSEQATAHTAGDSCPVEAANGGAPSSLRRTGGRGGPARERGISGWARKLRRCLRLGGLPAAEARLAGVAEHIGPACRFPQHVLECPGRGGKDPCTSIF